MEDQDDAYSFPGSPTPSLPTDNDLREVLDLMDTWTATIVPEQVSPIESLDQVFSSMAVEQVLPEQDVDQRTTDLLRRWEESIAARMTANETLTGQLDTRTSQHQRILELQETRIAQMEASMQQLEQRLEQGSAPVLPQRRPAQHAQPAEIDLTGIFRDREKLFSPRMRGRAKMREILSAHMLSNFYPTEFLFGLLSCRIDIPQAGIKLGILGGDLIRGIGHGFGYIEFQGNSIDTTTNIRNNLSDIGRIGTPNCKLEKYRILELKTYVLVVVSSAQISAGEALVI